MTTEIAPETEPALISFDEQVFSSLSAGIQDWINNHLLSIDMAIQSCLILSAFVLGAVIARMISRHLSKGIEKLRLPMGLRTTMHNLRRLLPVGMAVILMFITLIVGEILQIKISLALLDATMHLGAAWIIIRMLVQVVKNPTTQYLVAGLIWIVTALSLFGYLDDTAQVLDSLSITFGEFRLSALTITKAVVVTIILLYGASALSKVIEHQLGNVPNLTPGSRLLITKLARILLMVTAILIGISLAGINLAMLAVFSGAVGLGIGLGLQRGISNLFTGMMLLLDKTIQPGDIIEMPDGTLGSVYHMGSRCTELRSLDNRSYLIPNEHLVSNQVINWSRGSTEVLQSVTFGVDYKHNPHDIIKIAIDATRGIPRILHDPICHFSGFGDSSLDFTLRFWIKDPENGTGGLKSEIYLALWDAFAKNNIEIPYPHRKVIHG